ncbi:hypothetical protein Tco_0398259, partial [Tanacetum coccineum]
SMIGSLMYLTASRPDTMFAVCACARFQVTLKASHLNAVKRIFRISMDWRMDRSCAANSTHIWSDYIVLVRSMLSLVDDRWCWVTSLEKELKETKQTLGNVVVKLVKKVKSLETALKRKSKKVIMSESESEEPEDQGRIIQDIDDDPLVSLGKERYRREARSMAKKINTGLDAEDEINTGRVEINFGSENVNTEKEKAKSLEEDFRLLIRRKEQIKTEEARLEEAIRLQAQMDEEVAKQIHLDKMLAKRVQEEQELSKEQLKRKAELGDYLLGKLEANTEVVKSLQGENISNDDFAKRMVEMINEKKKFYAEQKAKAKRSKPMTQVQQREYMSTFIKNQSSWKFSQLKKLSFEELKTEFEKLMKSIESFMPMETKARVKRHGLQLEQETSKKQKIDWMLPITNGKRSVCKERRN